MPASPDTAALRDAYGQLCASYHAIDDFRAKLLGLLPLVTGGGLAIATGKGDDVSRGFLLPLGLLGLVVTAGLYSYEVYGIAKCHALIKAGRSMEDGLGLDRGQFQERPRSVLGLVNEPFAAAIIYPAVGAAWAYLAAFEVDGPAAGAIAGVVFVAGLAVTLNYNRVLARDAGPASSSDRARVNLP